MKKNILFLLISITCVIITACNKDNIATVKICNSSEIPLISIEGAPTNIIEIPDNFDICPKEYTTSIPVIVGSYDNYGKNQGLGLNAETDSPGTFNFGFFRIGREQIDTTFDNSFVFHQSVWKDNYVRYVNYGEVETIFCTRMRGKGTRYLDLSLSEKEYETERYKTTDAWYIKGTVVNIQNSTSETSCFYCNTVYKNYFQEWGYVPFLSYENDSILLTIITETGEATIKVYGKSRDKEIEKLLDYIHPGDNVEIPALFNSNKNLKNKDFLPVLSCTVLKLP